MVTVIANAFAVASRRKTPVAIIAFIRLVKNKKTSNKKKMSPT
jgi:hypothetical protein